MLVDVHEREADYPLKGSFPRSSSSSHDISRLPMTSPLPSIGSVSKDAHMTSDNLGDASSVLQIEDQSSNRV
jgi:hypothetical protein